MTLYASVTYSNIHTASPHAGGHFCEERGQSAGAVPPAGRLQLSCHLHPWAIDPASAVGHDQYGPVQHSEAQPILHLLQHANVILL